MRRRGTAAGAADLVGAPPMGVGVARASGALLLERVSPDLGHTLGVRRSAGGRPALALAPDDAERLRAVVAGLVTDRAQQAAVQLAGVHGPVWVHLRATPRRPRSAGGGVPVLLLAEPAPPRVAATEGPDDRAALVDRLGVALARRGSGRVAVAVAHVRGPRGSTGSVVGPQLLDRVRGAARGSDSVGGLGGDTVAVVAEDLDAGGELAVGRRLTAFLQRQVPDGGDHGVCTVATTVTDRSLDPEGLLQHLADQARSPTAEHGLTVLPPWTSASPTGSGAAGVTGVAGALASGRFVLGVRPVGALRPGPDAAEHTRLVEVTTADDGRLSPVRVAAPGLAAALDGWLLDRVAREVADGPVVVRLQPGGTLTPTLGTQVLAVAAARPGLRLVVQVPEQRLAEALAAERAVLARLSTAGIELGVAGWTGRLSPALLAGHGIGLVELAADVPAGAPTPAGAALVAGLCAGLRAGIGGAVVVLADRPESAEQLQALAEAGVAHGAPVEPVPLSPTTEAPR